MMWSHGPALIAALNGLSAVLLLAGFYFIRRDNVPAHKRCMLSAFASSTLFLIVYLAYHAHAGVVYFHGTGPVRTFYLGLLSSHTILAMFIPVLAIITLGRGLRMQVERHRAIARWTLPLWMYVSVTGVLVYLMLYWLYPG
jgi:uncharacterized membrane protein YozB (DUF420 family)